MNNNVFLSLKQGIINTERDKFKSQKGKEIQDMTEEGKSFLKKKVKEKERRRQNQNSNKAKYFKNIDFDSKYLKVIDKPTTPHNTGQYIVNKFNSSQKEDDTDYLTNDIDIDDFCCGLDIKNVIENKQCIEEESNEFQVKRSRYMSSDFVIKKNMIKHQPLSQPQKKLQQEDEDSNANKEKNEIDMEIDNMLSLHKHNSFLFDVEDIDIDEEM